MLFVPPFIKGAALPGDIALQAEEESGDKWQ